MTTFGNICVANDPMNRILWHLDDVQSLGRTQRVSKNIYTLASNDTLWKNLFKRVHGVDLPQEANGKEMLKNSIIIKNENQLIDLVVTFLCHPKWNKTTRLECVFPKPPSATQTLSKENLSVEEIPPSQIPTLTIELSFGPESGTQESMHSLRNETKYASFVGNVQLLPSIGTKLLNYETNSIMPYKPMIPYFIQIHSPIQLSSWNAMLSSYFVADIKKVNVGYGNTLGYFSSINQWKEPFELFCISGSNESHKWAGLIPYSEFKFVKIDQNSKITWENTDRNRSWGPRSSYSWEEYLKHVPVSFNA